MSYGECFVIVLIAIDQIIGLGSVDTFQICNSLYL